MPTRPALADEHKRLLWLLAVATFFEGYDFSVITVALPQLRDDFGLSKSSASLWVAVLYLGALPAVWLTRRADRFGRRQALLISITGYTVATACTAVTPSIETFVAAQFVARFFIAAEVSVSWTLVAEELPADRRGFGFGILALADALGVGWASILQATVLAPTGASWRWLYAAAVPVLLVAAFLRRALPESHRFTSAAREHHLVTHWSAVLRPPHRRRLLLVAGTLLLLSLSSQAVTFVVDFMQSERGLSSSAANITLVGAGTLVLPVLTGAGRLSDRVGRKPVVCTALVVEVAGLFVFFFLAHGQLPLLAALTLVYAGTFAAWPTGGSFGTEMFPTNVRALANSTVAIARLVGQFFSFALASAFIALTGTQANAVAILTVGPLAGAVLIARFFPETGGRDLEDVAAELPPLVGVSAVPPEDGGEDAA